MPEERHAGNLLWQLTSSSHGQSANPFSNIVAGTEQLMAGPQFRAASSSLVGQMELTVDTRPSLNSNRTTPSPHRYRSALPLPHLATRSGGPTALRTA